MSNSNLTPSSLNVIRLALLGGVLLFGGVIFYLHANDAGPSSTMDLSFVPIVFVALCAGAAGGIVFLRGALTRAATFGQRATLAVIAWALGESTALFGGVHWLLSGRPWLYLAGLAVFLVALTTVLPAEG